MHPGVFPDSSKIQTQLVRLMHAQLCFKKITDIITLIKYKQLWFPMCFILEYIQYIHFFWGRSPKVFFAVACACVAAASDKLKLTMQTKPHLTAFPKSTVNSNKKVLLFTADFRKGCKKRPFSFCRFMLVRRFRNASVSHGKKSGSLRSQENQTRAA